MCSSVMRHLPASDLTEDSYLRGLALATIRHHAICALRQPAPENLVAAAFGTEGARNTQAPHEVLRCESLLLRGECRPGHRGFPKSNPFDPRVLHWFDSHYADRACMRCPPR